MKMSQSQKCILYDRECIQCGECRCDLDPDKVCDNCMKCMIGDAEWRAIQITGISMGQDQDKPDEDKPAY